MEQKTVFIKTFGCQMNVRDSDILMQSLVDCGYTQTLEMFDADLVVLNTCSIRAKAEQKVMSLLGYLKKAKQKQPNMKICIAGCVAQQEGEKIFRKMPHVDLIIGTQHVHNIGELLKNARSKEKRIVIEMCDNYTIPTILPGLSHGKEIPSSPHLFNFKRFVTIMQGCDNYCTYCVVPYTRGREISRQLTDIVDEIKALVDTGVKEINLLGQNVNSYGKTNTTTDIAKNFAFSDLLKVVSRIKHLKRLRFTTSNPKDLSDDLMKCFADIENLCSHFHLPVQSGSDAVLRRMNRKYTSTQYLEKIQKLRRYCPEIAITTDIIVGFPGESENDFAATMALLETVKFHGSFSFKYSDRPDTQASQFKDKISEYVKSSRLAILQRRQGEISLDRNKEYLGKVKKVMIEQNSDQGMKGRTETNHIVHFGKSLPHAPGEIVNTKIIHAGAHSLQGSIVKQKH